VVQKTNNILPQDPALRLQQADEDMSADEDADIPEDVKTMQQIASFDKMTVWGHESLPSETDDVYMRGIEEWVKLAQTVSETR